MIGIRRWIAEFTERQLARDGVQTNTDLWRQARDWEYSQVDASKTWVSEDDAEALAQAFALRESYPDKALAADLQLAEAGSIMGMDRVGEAYWYGHRAERDLEKAEMWLRRAYEAGSQRAVLTYGELLTRQGDLAGAKHVYRVAAEDGWAPALYRLGAVLLRDRPNRAEREKARGMLEQATALGHPGARFSLAREMASGRFGLRRVREGWRLLLQQVQERRAAARDVRRRTASGKTVH